MEYTYQFPVVKGIQAGREYFIAMVPLKMIPRLFPNDEEYVAPEYRAQRKLNEARIPVICNYILENRDTYVFSSLAASIDGDFKFHPVGEGSDLGQLEVAMDARFLINDGQHRKAAILKALQEDPALGDETISIVFFEDKGLARSQQIFTDLNKNAVKTSNSISELYDSRDNLAVASRKAVSCISFLNAYTDKEKDNLGKFSSNFFTLNTFYLANKNIFPKGKIADENLKNAEEFLVHFWQCVTNNMVQWQKIENKSLTKVDLRQNYISSQGVVIQAFGIVGRYFYENRKLDMEKYLNKVRNIDWKRNNPIWRLRAIGETGRILTNKKAICLIANVIKQAIGLPLSDQERNLETQLQSELDKVK